MTRKFDFSIDEFYHIYNRGTDKRLIFINDNDYQRFTKLLYLCNSKNSIVFRDIPIGLAYVYDRGETYVDIGAYCLMPNHFHLLLHEKEENGISSFMQKLSTAYSSYFNKKHGRTGGLFEGPFLATHVDNDEYLKYLFSYIHLNPVKIIDTNWREKGIVNRDVAKTYLKNYAYSSFNDYLGITRNENSIISRNSFPDYFIGSKDFEYFIDEWLKYKDNSNT